MSSAPSDPLPTPSEPDNPAPLPSTVVEVRKIAGLRYQVLRPHDKGGIGEVFVALDQELNREVALKEMQERHAADAHICGRFVREAEITGGLEHPGIVPVYGLGQYDDGRPFYAMRFIQGETLRDAIIRYHRSDKGAMCSPEFELRSPRCYATVQLGRVPLQERRKPCRLEERNTRSPIADKIGNFAAVNPLNINCFRYLRKTQFCLNWLLR